MQKLNYVEFNYHLKRARYDPESFDILFKYCIPFIKKHIVFKFGYKQSMSFLSTAPYDIITKIIFDSPPKGVVFKPKSYLRKVATNFVISQYNLKDNQTLELSEEYAYVQEYDDSLDFSSLELRKAWNDLDDLSRYIVFMDIYEGWQLKDLAQKLDINYDYVRMKKSRAMKAIKEAIKKAELK